MGTDNQQETVEDVELAWLAGVLDSDGSVQMTVPKSEKGARRCCVNVWIDFSNSDPAIINRVIDILDRIGLSHYDGEKRIKPIYKQDGTYYLSKTKICLFTRVSRLVSIEKALSLLHPFLVGQKKAHSEIILRFVRKRISKGRKKYDGEDLMVVQEFFRQRNGRFAAKHVETLDRLLNDCTPCSQAS